MDCFPVSSFGQNFPFTQTSSPLLGGDAKVAFSLWWAVGVGSPCSHRWFISVTHPPGGLWAGIEWCHCTPLPPPPASPCFNSPHDHHQRGCPASLGIRWASQMPGDPRQGAPGCSSMEGWTPSPGSPRCKERGGDQTDTSEAARRPRVKFPCPGLSALRSIIINYHLVGMLLI